MERVAGDPQPTCRWSSQARIQGLWREHCAATGWGGLLRTSYSSEPLPSGAGRGGQWSLGTPQPACHSCQEQAASACCWAISRLPCHEARGHRADLCPGRRAAGGSSPGFPPFLQASELGHSLNENVLKPAQEKVMGPWPSAYPPPPVGPCPGGLRPAALTLVLGARVLPSCGDLPDRGKLSWARNFRGSAGLSSRACG